MEDPPLDVAGYGQSLARLDEQQGRTRLMIENHKLWTDPQREGGSAVAGRVPILSLELGRRISLPRAEHRRLTTKGKILGQSVFIYEH